MTIIVASVTSTPTSTTVVPTRTSRSPSRKRAISPSRSAGLRRPWTSPTRSGASSPVSRSNSASAAAAHAVSTSSSMSSSSSKKPSVSSAVASAFAAAPIRGTTTNVRRPAAASSRTLSHVPSSSSGRRMPVRIGTRPAGAVRRVDTSRSAYRTWPSVRGIGVAVISRTCGRAAGRLCLERAALVDAEAVLLVHDREREVRERDGLLDERVGADDDPRLAGRDRLQRLPPRVALERPGQERHGTAEVLDEVGDRVPVLAGEEVGRREERALSAGERRRGERPCGNGGLARPDVTLDEPEHRDWPGEVVADLADRRLLVGGERRLVAELACQRRLERDADLVSRGPRTPRSRRVRPSPRPPARDHAQLEGEELVEREAPERGVARLERRRVVGVLERLRDGRQVLGGAQLRRQVLRVGVARLVQRLAHRLAQPRGGQPGRQPVDGDDPADVEQVRRIGLLELRVVEHDAEPAVLELAADDELVAGVQPALDEPPAEPGRLRGAGLVGEERGRDLDAPPVRLLDADVGDPDAGGDHDPVRRGVEVVELAHLAQVVVPPREVEQQVTHALDAEPPAGAPQDATRRRTRRGRRAGRGARRDRWAP